MLSVQSLYKPMQDLASDTLAYRDPETGELKPELATSWEQTAPDEWVFHLRPGVKFHDGTDFDAEAAAWNVTVQTDANTGKSRAAVFAPNLKASAVDPLTLDIKCESACPILDQISPHIQFTSPTYASKNPDKYMVWPIGTGPYYLAEWKDDYLLYKRFEDYWNKDEHIYFDEVKVVWREEASVRAAMVANGEADLATDLTQLEADQVPVALSVNSADSAVLRFRTRGANGELDPVWGDRRFRQALMYAIDCDAMAKTLMKGVVKCDPVPMNPASVGWVDDPGYPYDPAKARELLDEVLGAGKGIDITILEEAGVIPSEWSDAIISYWHDVGVNATVQQLEGDLLNAHVRPGPCGVPGGQCSMPPDVYILAAHTNDLFDASIPLRYMDCTNPASFAACDPAFIAEAADAGAKSGAERKTAMEEMVRKWVIGDAQVNGLWHTPYVFGASERLVWPHPQMLRIRPDEMSFSS
ncbi:MAG TPA: ABC transporter substrate-binding protein [Micromonosporaceae bacterium]